MSVYGAVGAPSQNTINYDSIMSTSLFNYQRTLTDNISKSNIIFYKIQENGMYESLNGGVAIQIPLMYQLGTADWYSDYDTLSTDPMDGITSAFFDWRQMAVPVAISRLEERKNATSDRIIDLLKSKIVQAELGIKQRFVQALMQGSCCTQGVNGSLTVNDSSQFNGSLGIDPLNLFINIAPNANAVVGNINPSTATWWANQSTASALTTANKASDFLFEFSTFINNCSKGPGGPPDCVIGDQISYELLQVSYFQVYRTQMEKNQDYPFPNVKFSGVTIFWDEFVPNAGANGTVNVLNTNAANGGTFYAINTQFMGIKYDTETNFVATEFMRPVNQDARVAHILWMGNLTMSNRRKMGVYYNIPRTLSWVI